VTGMLPDQRRSSRLLLALPITVSGVDPENHTIFRLPGDTIVVNQHGALIRTTGDLIEGEEIMVTVASTGQSGRARVVWSGFAYEGKYGIELEAPGNLWGVHFPPDDWQATGA